MPFDRLVRCVDDWAGCNGRTDVFAQIGPADWQPTHIAWTPFLEPAEFRAKVADAEWIVAHAGMGTILTALELGKPILVMPRRGELGETRNDHQVATARRLQQLRRIRVAYDEHELVEYFNELAPGPVTDRISEYASAELVGAIRDFVNHA